MIKCLGTRPINAPSVLTTGIVEKLVLSEHNSSYNLSTVQTDSTT